MAINEMRKKIKTLANQSRTNIGSEIDTAVEYEHVGMISDVELKHSSL